MNAISKAEQADIGKEANNFCKEPCKQWLIEKIPVCQNKLIRVGGCTECITGDWGKSG